MTLRDLVANLDHPVATGDLDTQVHGLAYDSRKVAQGTAFFALRGTQADGHRFIEQAIAAGCAAIIAEQAPPANSSLPWVHVRNSRLALAAASAAFLGHPARQLQIAAVTGTNGKTTTAFILHHLLNAAQMRCGLIGTIFQDVGGEQTPASHTTPESLETQGLLAQMRDRGCRACAIETSSHALEQGRTHGLPFAVAVFTNLTQDHLDYHGTMERYFAAKSILFDTVAAQEQGKMVINLDDSWGRKLIAQHEATGRVIRFGFGVQADFRAVNVRADPTGTSFELEVNRRSFLVRFPLIGDFNVHNALGALAAAHQLGLNLRESIQHLRNVPQVPGRLERITDQASFQVFVDYAHTPDALDNVLRTLRNLKPGRIITVFGCGGDRDRTKRPKMAAAAERGSDICVLTSDNPRSEDPETIIQQAAAGFTRHVRAIQVIDRREAIEKALRGATPGDIVLIAGKGHEDYQEIQGARHPFDDRQIAGKILYQLRAEKGDIESPAF